MNLKPVLLHLRIDLVSHPAHGRVLVNIQCEMGAEKVLGLDQERNDLEMYVLFPIVQHSWYIVSSSFSLTFKK